MSSIVKARHLICSTAEVTHKKREPHFEYSHEASIKSESLVNTSTIREQEEQYRLIEKKAMHAEKEALNRAEAIVENAMKTSKDILYEAEKKGYEEGYLRGLVEGANESFKAGEESILELRRLIEMIQQERLQIIRREEKSLLEISLQMCKKIIRRSVQADESVLMEMIKEVIHEQEGKIKIHVSEYQQTLDMKIDKELAKKIKSFSKDSKVVFLKEEDLILVETQNGVIDLSIPVQLEMMEKTLFDK